MINYDKFPQNNMILCLMSYDYNHFILIHCVTCKVYYYLDSYLGIMLYYYHVYLVYTKYTDYGITSIDNRNTLLAGLLHRLIRVTKS